MVEGERRRRLKITELGRSLLINKWRDDEEEEEKLMLV